MARLNCYGSQKSRKMTKEVLVSISGKHIDIMNDPTAGYETGDDNIEVVTPANYYCKNGKHYIIYEEVLEGMAGRSATGSRSPEPTA